MKEYSHRLRDVAREEKIFRARMLQSLFVVVVLSLVILWRYASLQLINYERYKTESDRNRIHTVPVAPKRGLIYDRNGVILAQNQATYSLVITRERVEDLDATLADLQQLFDVSEENIEKFLSRLKQRKPYQSVPLLFKLSDDEISRFAVNRFRLTGVEVVAQLTRDYPEGKEFAHILGYVGRINSREQEDILLDDDRRKSYAATTHIGKVGLEGYYEETLHGEVGTQLVESNAHGRVLRVLDAKDSVPGQDLVLTIDADLQKKAFSLVDGNRASIVVLDVRTGGVLAMVSTPGFDNNAFVKGISQRDYSVLRDSPDLPLFNRALQGQYPPGSTIKPIIGLGGLHFGQVSQYTTISDPGWYKLPNDDRLYRDWKRTGHGKHVDLRDAIVESCDVYFYDLAFNLGIDKIYPFMASFGFGRKTLIDSTSESNGLMPSREWKRQKKKMPWFPGETLNIGIGQGYMLATPLQLAFSTAMVANKGIAPRPHLVKLDSDRPGNESTEDGADNSYTTEIDLDLLNSVTDQHWQHIHLAMKDVIHSKKGTAAALANGMQYVMAGKTGTAQVIGIKQGEKYDAEAIAERQRDHALFVGFVPFDAPEIAVAVVVENGGSGATSAAPIAKTIFDWFMIERTDRRRSNESETGLYARLEDRHKGPG